MEKMRVSVKDGQIKVNENEGEKTSGTWRVRCHNRAGEAVTHTCTALPSGERPRLLCRPHLINPFALVNIPPLTLPQLSTLFHFHYSPLEPVRQTLRDYTIITLFPHRLELLPELTLTVWSDPPPPQGPQWHRWQPQMLMIPCLETTPSSSTPSCRGNLTSLWSQRPVHDADRYKVF